MKITRLMKSPVGSNTFLFETDPPLTDEVMDKFNENVSDPDALFSQIDGKLMITEDQMTKEMKGRFTKKPVEVFSRLLTEAESALKADELNQKQVHQSKQAQVAGWFGVPVEE